MCVYIHLYYISFILCIMYNICISRSLCFHLCSSKNMRKLVLRSTDGDSNVIHSRGNRLRKRSRVTVLKRRVKSSGSSGRQRTVQMSQELETCPHSGGTDRLLTTF